MFFKRGWYTLQASITLVFSEQYANIYRQYSTYRLLYIKIKYNFNFKYKYNNW